MAHLALYRKYRPIRFDDIIAQENIVKVLKSQVQSQNISHAYLFCGSRGTGKTSIAKIFARAINCEKNINGSPCNKCAACKATENIDILEIDAASNNRVDEIRELRENIKFPPLNGKFKVYIIDEVHMLSDSAFNALLKTLEEPPAHAVFILATTEMQKLPATILSRCIRFNFRLSTQDELVTLLDRVLKDSDIKFETDALKIIADAAEGSNRDALSIADMCASYCENFITCDKVNKILSSVSIGEIFKLCENILNANFEEVFKIYNTITSEGKGINILLKELISFFKNLIIAKNCGNAAFKILPLPLEYFKKLLDMAEKSNEESALTAIQLLSGIESASKVSMSPVLLFETTLIKILYLFKESNLDMQKKTNPEEFPKNIKMETIEQKIKKNKPLTFSEIWGRLLLTLKDGKYKALYGSAGEIFEGNINKDVITAISSESVKAYLGKPENTKMLEEIIFENELIRFKVNFELKIEKKDETAEKLKELLGEKLIIEE